MAAVMIEKELPVTAILADSVDLALGAIDALRQHGRDVPRDVSVIGFDYALTRAGRSHLTAVCVDAVEVGRQLARLAIGMANQSGRDVPPVVVPATLVKRSTCRPFRAEAHMVL
jgi:DNA-binding LacI/PurR family transcriptional regulator